MGPGDCWTVGDSVADKCFVLNRGSIGFDDYFVGYESTGWIANCAVRILDIFD